MPRTVWAVIVGALVLFVVVVVGAMTFTGGGSSSRDDVHRMQDGSMMDDREMEGMTTEP